MKAKAGMLVLAVVALATFTGAAVAQGYPQYPGWAEKAFCSFQAAC